MGKGLVKILSSSEFSSLLKRDTQKKFVPLDASWYLPNVGKNGKKEFLNDNRIERSEYFDLEEVALQNAKYPHTLPTPDIFKKELSQLGVSKSSKLVFYDRAPNFSSPRAAWTAKLFGHEEVYLLDNFVKYQKEGFPVDSSERESLRVSKAEDYELAPLSEIEKNFADEVISYEDLLELLKSGELAKDYYLFDARAYERFTGDATEPRPGVRVGHIPSSLSLPFSEVLNSDKSFKSKDDLVDLFSFKFNLSISDLNNKKGIIVSCGSGVTAVILRVAIQSIIGVDVPVRVYDGSWTEWSDRAPDEFIVKGT